MTPTPQLSLGLLLTAAAGFADVVSFIELGGHFTSFMSGNTTQLGDALALGHWPVVLLTASLVLLFFLGSVFASLLALLCGTRWGSSAVTALVLLAFAATLCLAAIGLPSSQFMLILAAGAGAQNAILPSTGSVRLGTTFVTGTLFAAGQDLARALRGLAPPWRWAQHALVWASLLLGGLLGGYGYAQLGINALLVPALVYLGFLIAFVVRRPGKVIG
ncbi:MAG: YoaK family protein [Devosia sp.]